MSRTIGVIYGTWNYYKQVEETGDFYDKYEVEEYTDEVFPILMILWGDCHDELDTRDFDYQSYPTEWKDREGVAVLEANHAVYEIDEELTNLELVSTKGVNLNVYDSVYDDADWDVQEVEEVVDLRTGEQVDPWAE